MDRGGGGGAIRSDTRLWAEGDLDVLSARIGAVFPDVGPHRGGGVQRS